MSVIRAFVALRLPEPVLAALAAFQEELRGTGADVRWVRREALHLTLQFLGDVPERDVPALAEALARAFREQTPVEADCRGVVVLPGWRRPRVLCAALHGGGLAALAARSETALAPLGVPPAERELRPHVTLGRVRSPRGFDAVAVALRAAEHRAFGASRFDHAVLYRSRLEPTGSVYEPLATLPFGAVND